MYYIVTTLLSKNERKKIKKHKVRMQGFRDGGEKGRLRAQGDIFTLLLRG